MISAKLTVVSTLSALATIPVLLASSGIAHDRLHAMGGDEKLAPGPIEAVKTVKIPCCRCIGGEGQSVDLSTGSAPWRLISGPGVTAPSYATAPSSINPAWTANLSPATWLGNTSGSQGTYIYELAIRLPKCVIPMASIKLSGKAAADNSFSASLIAPSGTATPLGQTPASGGIYGFQATNVGTLSGTLTTPGLYKLQVKVNNQGGPQGLLLNAVLKTTCSKELEQGNAAKVEDAMQ